MSMLESYSLQNPYPGPNKEGARAIFKATLGPELQSDALAKFKNEINDIIDNIIDESIDEGMDKYYEYVSHTGWLVGVKPACIKAIKDIYARKLKEFKN